jgi:hypothetical protein
MTRALSVDGADRPGDTITLVGASGAHCPNDWRRPFPAWTAARCWSSPGSRPRPVSDSRPWSTARHHRPGCRRRDRGVEDQPDRVRQHTSRPPWTVVSRAWLRSTPTARSVARPGHGYRHRRHVPSPELSPSEGRSGWSTARSRPRSGPAGITVTAYRGPAPNRSWSVVVPDHRRRTTRRRQPVPGRVRPGRLFA